MMWIIRLANTHSFEEKFFEFSNGHFVNEDEVLKFAEGNPLRMCSITKEGADDPVYREPTLFSQLIIFDGERFLFNDMYKRLFQNFKKSEVLVELSKQESMSDTEKSIILESSIVFIAATLSAYLKDMVEAFCINRESFIKNGSKAVFKRSYDQQLKRFNNASSKNLKDLLKSLNLYPDVLEHINCEEVDKLVDLRNRLSHGAIIEDQFSPEEIQTYLEASFQFMTEISSSIYRKVAHHEEMSAWPTTLGENKDIDKFWSLLPLLNEG